MKTLIVSVLLFCLVSPVLSQSAEQDDGAQLRLIKKRIEATAGNLDKQKSVAKGLLRDLSVVSTTIKKIDRRIDTIKLEKKKVSLNLDGANRELRKTQQKMGQLKKKVNKRLVALYKEGEMGPLKLFFTSASPMELAQQYEYLSLVLQHDQQLLDQFREGLEDQRAKQHKLELLQAEQEKLLNTEQKNRKDAAQGRKLYKQILQQARKDEKKLAKELKELKSRAQRLKNLVNKLDNDQKQQPVTKGSFAKQKGRLPWPIKGSVTVGFGTQHNKELGSVLESNGIEINYRTAQAVRAVAPGRIVFASWFKGYGNLMIIAHDNGYHSLYAQAERLEGGIGDTVQQGDIIAQTGPPTEQGLYFEIRHNGTAIDPIRWLRSNM